MSNKLKFKCYNSTSKKQIVDANGETWRTYLKAALDAATSLYLACLDARDIVALVDKDLIGTTAGDLSI